ncbi:MAG: hypothetical protein COB85_01200 [Bacteroidetes bacterium]|nr:MAG: hypothetical protein COB85_01200 [Bacteroidota bacterium]
MQKIQDILKNVYDELGKTTYHGITIMSAKSGHIEFELLGGKFTIVQSLVWNDKGSAEGRLTLYHDRGLPIKDRVVKVEDFEVRIPNRGTLWIKNHLSNPNLLQRYTVNHDDELLTDEGFIGEMFFRQLESYIIEGKLEIFPTA